MQRSTCLCERAKFWHAPAFNNLELLHATYITHRFAPHAHEGFAIGVAQAGVQVFSLQGRNHFMPAGSIAVINPGEIHTGQAAVKQGWTYRMMYPKTLLLQRAASQLIGRDCHIPYFRNPIIYDDYLARLIVDLHMALEEPQTPVLELESRLLWTFGQLIIRHADNHFVMRPTAVEHQAIKQVKAYLESHYAQNISLDALAQLVHLSPFYLVRTFKESVGLPPHAYLTHLRIIQAKKLLLAGLPIVDIAMQTGFTDQSHFTRRFKGIVGVTPGQYRKNVQYNKR